MRTKKISFKNSQGDTLSAKLEMPLGQKPVAFALFAHCFTCSKDLQAVTNIGNALASRGFAVLKFDFTGLGESEGEFAETNFSSNISDLISASKFLEKEYEAPELIIGHSLGGAAVLRAAAEISSLKGVVTIAAPADPTHVKHLLEDKEEDIRITGQAKVNIGGRSFTIKKQFLEDLEENSIENVLPGLKKALLILHSPQDEIVEIKNAAKIYSLAKHPKSFISLDGANHLLAGRRDSIYVGDVISSWASRYLEIDEERTLNTSEQVAVRTGTKYTSEIKAGKHRLIADEPENVGGDDMGPGPYEFLLASLGACKGMTLRMYADRKNWDLKETTVHLSHQKKHTEDCENCDEKDSKIDVIDVMIEVEGDLEDQQRARLIEISEKCPVHRTLTGDIKIESKLKK